MLTKQEDDFRSIYEALKYYGKEISPRGEKVLELENFSFVFAPYMRFINFKSRKLNLNYIKKEFLWYLKGDKFDTSISEYANLWKTMIDKDGIINSNYGQYMFSPACPQFFNVFDILCKDPDSRRATIMILQPQHLLSEDTKDYPCTYALSFRIREGKLKMSVCMRSQDAVYGLGNDLPIFSFIHEMMFIKLKRVYTYLEYGDYYHYVNSFHIYEKHYDLLDKIVDGDEFEAIECPKMQSECEVNDMLNFRFEPIPYRSFSDWLKEGVNNV